MKHDEFTINAKARTKRRNIISDLEDIDDIVLPSSIQVKEEPKKKANEKEIGEDTSEWLDEIMAFTAPKPKKKKGKGFKGFMNEEGAKTKKRKTKDKGEMKNYQKEFDPELTLLKNLYMSQSKFTDSLQKKYDAMENAKSTARGVGKFTTDLIMAINTARSTTLQIMDKTISTKKIIADLNVKERKEFGAKSNSEQENNAQFASTYLKQMMAAGRNNVLQAGYQQPQGADSYNLFTETNDDNMFSSIEKSLGSNARDDSVDTFLKYENANIEVSVVKDMDGEWDFVAMDANGTVVPDYPMPMKSKMSFNPSLGMAIDEYGQKYPLIEQ